MREAKAMILWLFIIFIALPLTISLCLYSKGDGLCVSLGMGFIRFYVFLIIGVFLIRLIAKITSKGDDDE